MALSVDWSTYVITIPKADLTLVQVTPTEIYEIDLNLLHHWLREVGASEAGILNQKTHNHNTSVLLGGIEFARIVELLDPYSITFEDGQYAVRFIGANTNLADKVNVNQVSVRPNNSAGLISSPDIEFSAYKDGVVYNAMSPYSGTTHPTGTERQPVNNLIDAGLIAQYRGINKGRIKGGTLTIGNETPIANFHLMGEGATRTVITILPEAVADNLYVEEAHILGTLDGNVRLVKCLLTDLNYVNGYIDECILSQGKIVLGGSEIASVTNCAAGVGTPEIDMGGAGQGLILQKYSGPIKISNKTGAEAVVIGLDSGIVSIDMLTVTNGTIVASGDGIMVDSNTSEEIITGTYGNLEIINLLNGNESAARAIFNTEIENGQSFANVTRINTAVLAGKVTGAETATVTFSGIDEATDRVVAVVDENGNRISVTLDGT